MKTATNKTNDTTRSNSTKPFFNTNSKETFFNHFEVAQRPFFSPSVIQPKIEIGNPGDKYEQEADRIAVKVVSNSREKTLATDTQPANRTFEQNNQPQELRGDHDDEFIMEPNFFFNSKEPYSSSLIQGKEIKETNQDIDIPLQNSKGQGQALDPKTKFDMEQSFAFNFKAVRVHTGNKAAEMNQKIGSKAFTSGHDIYFNEGNYNPDSEEGRRLLAHELTHVVQQNSDPILNQLIQRKPWLTKLQGLEKEIAKMFFVNKANVFSILGQLTASEKKKVLTGNASNGKSYKAQIASSMNVKEMLKVLRLLTVNDNLPNLPTKLSWIKAAGTPDYNTIRKLITSAKNQQQRDTLNTTEWRNFFIKVCDNKSIFTAVKDLNFDLQTKLTWISHELENIRYQLKYSDIQPLIKTVSNKKELNALKTDQWKSFFLAVCTNKTIIRAVDDLKFDLATKLKWMIAEGTNATEIRKKLNNTRFYKVWAAFRDPELLKLLSQFTKTNLVAERLAKEILRNIKLDAQDFPVYGDAYLKNEILKSNFYKSLKNTYLKDYLKNPSPATGKKAVDLIGKPMKIRKNSSGIIEVKPDNGAWRRAEGVWEKRPELFKNLFIVPKFPQKQKNLAMFKTLPSKLEAATGILVKENLAKLPYLDAPFLLKSFNSDRNKHKVYFQIKGGLNALQILHWATGIKASDKSPMAIREMFLAIAKRNKDGWDVFGLDSLNNLIAMEQGRLLGAELRKGMAGAIKKEADLLTFLLNSFKKARAWVGALIRLRKTELDNWILAKEQKKGYFRWAKFGVKDFWGSDTFYQMLTQKRKLSDEEIWSSDTAYQMLAKGIPMHKVVESNLYNAQVEIYKLIYAADRWESQHGPIKLTDLEKSLVKGNIEKP